MSLRSLSPYLLLLRFYPIFSPHVLAASSAAGQVKLYDDFNCGQPSTINPTVTLALSTCLVTANGGGLIIAELPPCPQSTATLIYYQDSACGVPTEVSIAITSDNCNQLAAGTDLYNAKSVMFSCQPAANNPQPSSTTTAVVSALAAVATGSTGDSGSASSKSSTTAAASVPTDPSSSTNGTSTSGGNSGSRTGSSANSSGSSGSSSGLDTGDIIALSVGLGIGIPTIVIMLATWLFPDFRLLLRRWLSCLLDDMAFRNEPQRGPYHDTQGLHPQRQPFPLHQMYSLQQPHPSQHFHSPQPSYSPQHSFSRQQSPPLIELSAT
ncbi:hypothetical protein BDR22DRAFT_819530 [Usnea florida]